MRFLLNTRKKFTKSGFTLVELLVVISIFIIITVVVLASQNKFSSDIQLTDLAYQIAISIRQAQVYGLGVKGSGASFNIGYGVRFTTTAKTSYQLISDNNADKLYDQAPNPPDSLLSTYQIQQGATISNLCVKSGGATTCSSQGLSTLDIIYIRPNPASNISMNGAFIGGVSYDQASITITSNLKNRWKCITVYATGQVSVSQDSNPCPTS